MPVVCSASCFICRVKTKFVSLSKTCRPTPETTTCPESTETQGVLLGRPNVRNPVGLVEGKTMTSVELWSTGPFFWISIATTRLQARLEVDAHMFENKHQRVGSSDSGETPTICEYASYGQFWRSHFRSSSANECLHRAVPSRSVMIPCTLTESLYNGAAADEV